MPNPINNVTGGQWELCERCGFLFPMGKLTKQKGMLLCERRCIDNLEVERRDNLIMKTLTVDTHEGEDTRLLDRSFFMGNDDETV